MAKGGGGGGVVKKGQSAYIPVLLGINRGPRVWSACKAALLHLQWGRREGGGGKGAIGMLLKVSVHSSTS